MTDQKRLTLIEILIVVAVIGLIGTLSAVAVSSARANARDAVRLSNVRQTQAALENFFVARNAYPITENVVSLGVGSAGCLTTEGFQSVCDATTEGVLMKTVPVAPDNGLNGLSSCGGVANAFCFLAIKDGESYVIQFELEHAITSAKLQRGLNCATPEGMVAGACSVE
ncbi:MAG: type II secretion system protein [Patescibacteria group bacterium]|jgi:type II secretory pathway pseudopilin PulG